MTAAQRADVLPRSLPPFALNREQAAAFVNLSVTLFDKCVLAGSMPAPRVLGGRLIYLVEDLMDAARRAPGKAGMPGKPDLDETAPSDNPWD
jgi:hypothetical protein